MHFKTYGSCKFKKQYHTVYKRIGKFRIDQNSKITQRLKLHNCIGIIWTPLSLSQLAYLMWSKNLTSGHRNRPLTVITQKEHSRTLQFITGMTIQDWYRLNEQWETIETFTVFIKVFTTRLAFYNLPCFLWSCDRDGNRWKRFFCLTVGTSYEVV